MTRSTPFRFHLFEISFGILAALALAFSPQAALAQHGGGGGHAGGGGHFGGGGGGHFSGGAKPAGFGTGGHSNAAVRVASPVHVFSGPRSTSAAASARAAQNSAALNGAGRGAAVELGSSNTSASTSSSPRDLGMFAGPDGSGEAALGAQRAMPMHTTIGFPPSTDPRFMSISSERGREPLSFSGQGQQIWRNSQGVTVNRSSVRVTEMPRAQRAFPTPPHLPRRPFLGGAPFLSGEPGFIFFNPGFGFFGNGFGCDPFFTPSFGCGFSPFGFGGFGGFGYLGFGGGYGYGGYANGFDDNGYGYDGGYYAPPNLDVTPPNFDEGASQEPAPGPYLNPPAENSSPDNSSVENSAPAPETVIYLKDGTSFAVKDYWVADGQLHYITSYGGENSVNLNLFDLQRTTDENAKQGIAITLRPAPESQPPASQPPAPQSPNAPPAPNPAPEGAPR